MPGGGESSGAMFLDVQFGALEPDTLHDTAPAQPQHQVPAQHQVPSQHQVQQHQNQHQVQSQHQVWVVSFSQSDLKTCLKYEVIPVYV
ncbi:hypothetical protein RR48_00260 [Papilio machaon]|uniref:Uncharacterized protein n=1 Tax=Papilio machaon TaxID=76193 RepID=A0A0N1IJA9_PAPMA|nr:hypothetical protein RR48_00260 [Papilio machaon]